MAEATAVTGGAYDPTVRGHGCGGSWVEAVAVDPVAAVAQVTHGITLDPGGIGKGLAADLVVAEAMAAGATAAAVLDRRRRSCGVDDRRSSLDDRDRRAEWIVGGRSDRGRRWRRRDIGLPSRSPHRSGHPRVRAQRRGPGQRAGRDGSIGRSTDESGAARRRRRQSPRRSIAKASECSPSAPMAPLATDVGRIATGASECVAERQRPQWPRNASRRRERASCGGISLGRRGWPRRR